jgi:uncharacterized membrane protein YeaQ/YmgE (transglycosylase-associated protein family)
MWQRDRKVALLGLRARSGAPIFGRHVPRVARLTVIVLTGACRMDDASLLAFTGLHPILDDREGGTSMAILWSLIVGLVVGALAKLFMPGKDPGGIVVTMLLGVAGSLVAGFIGRALGWYSSVTHGPGIIASILGAMLLLFIYRLVVRRHRTV